MHNSCGITTQDTFGNGISLQKNTSLEATGTSSDKYSVFEKESFFYNMSSGLALISTINNEELKINIFCTGSAMLPAFSSFPSKSEVLIRAQHYIEFTEKE